MAGVAGVGGLVVVGRGGGVGWIRWVNLLGILWIWGGTCRTEVSAGTGTDDGGARSRTDSEWRHEENTYKEAAMLAQFAFHAWTHRHSVACEMSPIFPSLQEKSVSSWDGIGMTCRMGCRVLVSLCTSARVCAHIQYVCMGDPSCLLVWDYFCVSVPPAAPLTQQAPLTLFSREGEGTVCSLRCVTRLTHPATEETCSDGLSTNDTKQLNPSNLVAKNETLPPPCTLVIRLSDWHHIRQTEQRKREIMPPKERTKSEDCNYYFFSLYVEKIEVCLWWLIQRLVRQEEREIDGGWRKVYSEEGHR